MFQHAARAHYFCVVVDFSVGACCRESIRLKSAVKPSIYPVSVCPSHSVRKLLQTIDENLLGLGGREILVALGRQHPHRTPRLLWVHSGLETREYHGAEYPRMVPYPVGRSGARAWESLAPVKASSATLGVAPPPDPTSICRLD